MLPPLVTKPKRLCIIALYKSSKTWRIENLSQIARPEKFILDATAGFRMMWFNKKHPNCIYLDQRPECEPDIVGDFRDLKQFPDETFRLVIWDPPHIIEPKAKNLMRLTATFGALRPDCWQDDLSKGFRELFRVLKQYGILIFKWSNFQIPSNQVIELARQQPLIYQISTSSSRRTKGRKGNSESGQKCLQTLWFCFMKIPEVKPNAES